MNKAHCLALLLSLCSPMLPAMDFDNCAQTWSLAQPAQRVLALNQHAADLLLALGAQPQLLGVTYIDDAPAALREGHYHGVPLIAARYPSAEAIYALGPDLLVGGFASAFGQGLLGRDDLAANGMASYLLDGACATRAPSYFAGIEHDLATLGRLLGREPQAQQLIAAQRQELAIAARLAHGKQPLRVFYLDNLQGGLATQGSQGFIGEVMRAAGARNAFDEIAQRSVLVSPELLLSAEPDVILLADAVWSPAAEKIATLQADPVLSRLRAVREGRFVSLPFSHLFPGVHSATATRQLAEALYGP